MNYQMLFEENKLLQYYSHVVIFIIYDENVSLEDFVNVFISKDDLLWWPLTSGLYAGKTAFKALITKEEFNEIKQINDKNYLLYINHPKQIYRKLALIFLTVLKKENARPNIL